MAQSPYPLALPNSALVTDARAAAPPAIFTLLGHAGLMGASDGRCQEPVGKDLSPASPVDVALPSRQLLKLNQALDAGKHDIRSLLIVRDCRIVFERCKAGIGREHNHTLYSATKSITAGRAGLSLKQGARMRSRRQSLPVAGWAIALAGSMLLSSAHAASFPCEKASSAVEKAICASAEISELDEYRRPHRAAGGRRGEAPDRFDDAAGIE